MSTGHEHEQAMARENALISACNMFRAGERNTDWLHTDNQVEIGIGHDVVKVRLTNVNKAFAKLWVSRCRSLARPSVFDYRPGTSEHNITFEPA